MEIRQINCSNLECGNWEEFPADIPRNKSQTFEFISPLDNNGGIYKCMVCGSLCENNINPKDRTLQDIKVGDSVYVHGKPDCRGWCQPSWQRVTKVTDSEIECGKCRYDKITGYSINIATAYMIYPEVTKN